MKWFGRKAASQEARPFSLRSLSAIEAREGPRGYEALVREAYLANPVAQRAVRLIAEGCGGAVVYDAAGVRDAEAAEGLASGALLETAAAHLLLHGNAFIRILCGSEGRPSECVAMRPERVRVETDANGWPAAYRYKAGAAASRIPARDGAGKPAIVHVRAIHPLDDHYGLGCLGAAAGAVAIHNAATRWNRALLDNAARPSGALSFEPGDGSALSEAQFETLRDELERSFQGAANAGRPLLLEGGLKWQAMSLTPADMDFVALKSAAAREIALAFGVPPMLVGLPGDAAFANYREANRALWRLTIMPMLDKLLSGLSQALGVWWPGLRLSIDADRVTALAEDRERLWRQVRGAEFLSRDEKREMLGFAPTGEE